MQSTILALGAFAGLAAAWGNSSYSAYTTTEVVSSYTTVCPGPTSVVEGNQTYTATSVSVHSPLCPGTEHEKQGTRPDKGDKISGIRKITSANRESIYRPPP